MIEKLINNFTLLTSFLFFGNMVRSRYFTGIKANSTLRRMSEGALLGIFGVLLIHFSFPLTEHVRADARQLAVLVSVYLGGWLSGLFTMAFLLIYRLFFVHEFNGTSVYAAINIFATLGIAISLINEGKLDFKRWVTALLLTDLLTFSFMLIKLQGKTSMDLSYFALFYLISGLLLYFMIRYLKRTHTMMQRMKEAAARDHLTGLYNTRSLEAYFEHRSDNSENEKHPYSMLVIDIDHFKEVNDTYGHAAGDAVLVQLAEVLNDSFRSGDYIARKGGEEFVVIVERCGRDKIGQVADNMRNNVQNKPFILPNGTRLNLTVSVGAASYPQTACTELFEQADQMLYKAKHLGRNRVCVG
ncbi:diguanylate cyclase [Paenibacillus physcomitrellae]|uniref:GGDEF domain-containing protein n=1 Tax=Paenibacillus physcomitrellae TaxID=1619311 RepID=A0ABQ1FS26_9BACL|nr:diguanylate cyclase [Paenibacillus physcomitrellae]GGA27374.1 hypothetical protein GCM10010917_10300 [Paenibacillus physcomitrellae]